MLRPTGPHSWLLYSWLAGCGGARSLVLCLSTILHDNSWIIVTWQTQRPCLNIAYSGDDNNLWDTKDKCVNTYPPHGEAGQQWWIGALKQICETCTNACFICAREINTGVIESTGWVLPLVLSQQHTHYPLISSEEWRLLLYRRQTEACIKPVLGPSF